MRLDRIENLAMELLVRGRPVKLTESERRQIVERFGNRDGMVPFIESSGSCSPVDSDSVDIVLNAHHFERNKPDDDALREAIRATLVGEHGDEAKVTAILTQLASAAKLREARGLPGSNYKLETLPSGILAQVRYKEAQRSDKPNRNQRIYAHDDMVIAVADVDKRAKQGEIFALGGHPGICETPTLRKTMGLVRGVEMGASGKVPLDLDIIEGEQGRAAFNLLRVGGALPISSRAYGNFEIVHYYKGINGEFGKEDDDPDDPSETFVLIKDFFFEAWDAVAGRQGVVGAIVRPKNRGAVSIAAQRENAGADAPIIIREGASSPEPKRETKPMTIENSEITRVLRDQATAATERANKAANELAVQKGELRFSELEVDRLKGSVKNLESDLAKSRTKNEALRTRLEAKSEELMTEKGKAADLENAKTSLAAAETAKATAEEAQRVAETAETTAETKLTETEAKLATAEAKANPAPKDPAFVALETELAEAKAKAKKAEETAAVKIGAEAVREGLAKSKYAGYSDLLESAILGGDNAPKTAEEAAEAVKGGERFVHSILERTRNNSSRRGAAPGKGIGSNGSRLPTSTAGGLNEGAGVPERGTPQGSSIASRMIGTSKQ